MLPAAGTNAAGNWRDFGTSRWRLYARTLSQVTPLWKRPLTSGNGTKLPIRDVRCSVAIGGKADVHRVVVNRRE